MPNSQRRLHSIGGDRRGRAWDAPEVAGREWGRLKHVIGHGAHFLLWWGAAGDTEKDRTSVQGQDKARRALWEGSGRLVPIHPDRDPPGWPPILPGPLQEDRGPGVPPMGLWIPQGLPAQHDQGQVASPHPQATPCPMPEAHTPRLPY